MPVHQRLQIDVTNRDIDPKTKRPKNHRYNHSIETYAVWHTGPIRFDPDKRVKYDADKWIVKITDLSDPRITSEFYFDNRFAAKLQSTRAIDLLDGFIKRKIRVKITRRITKTSPISHRKGATEGTGKEATRRRIESLYQDRPGYMPKVDRERNRLARIDEDLIPHLRYAYKDLK
jgi:hypothetical protein